MTLTVALFSGGFSRRMGRDKAQLAIEGEPLWSRQIRILRALRPQALFVSARARPIWCPPGALFVPDLPPARGPLSGLTAALALLRTTHLLALAIDLPAMTSGHLQLLQSLAFPGCGVIPSGGAGLEPLCALYPAAALQPARAALVRGDAALQTLARELLLAGRLRTYRPAVDERALYRNLNRPADLEALASDAR